MPGYNIYPQDIWEIPLKSDPKFILFYLYSFKNTKCIYPTIDTISKNTGISWDGVNRGLKHLEKSGYIEIKKQHRKPNEYKILWVSNCDPKGRTERPNRVSDCDPIINNIKIISKTSLNVISKKDDAHAREDTSGKITYQQEKYMLFKFLKDFIVNENGDRTTLYIDDYVFSFIDQNIEDLEAMRGFMIEKKIKWHQSILKEPRCLANKLRQTFECYTDHIKMMNKEKYT